MRRVFLCVFAGFLAVTFMAASVSYAGTTEAASVDSAGNLGNNDSFEPAISADGRYVTFQSVADNLVPGDTNGMTDVFVYDRQTGATEIVSRDSAGNPGNGQSTLPAISADGRYVTFRSGADNLVPDDMNRMMDVFVRDRQTGATEIVSKESAGNLANSSSTWPAISADGRYVAFHSWASNLVPGDTNETADVFVHDRQTGATEIVSRDSAGNPANGESLLPVISADGRYVAFESVASNLVPGDTNKTRDVFVHDRQTGATEIVSRDSAGIQGNGGSGVPSISADGRYVAFHSGASNLVPGDTNKTRDVFVHDRQTGATEIVSTHSFGIEGDGKSGWPSISADGRHVAFESNAGNLVPGDTNKTRDVFVHDRQTGVTEIVSRDSAGIQGNGFSSIPAISGNGRYVAFESDASNLVPGDTNKETDAFVHSRN